MPKARDKANHVDLESAVCDVADMANVCLRYSTCCKGTLDRRNGRVRKASRRASFLLAGDGVILVLHLKVMAEELKKQYYAGVE